MNTSESTAKIFVVDSNLFFVKRLSDALKQKGFEAVHCSEAAYALTMIEWNMPVAILCSTSSRGPNTFEIPAILSADAKTSHIPVIAIGDRGQQSQLEALRAGYEDFIDRRLGADEIASHLVSLLSSHKDGFQPTQMLARSETALDGRLSLVDLPGVIQVLEQSRQTGALHVNAGTSDGIIFFNSGEAIHSESGLLAGDDAIVCLIKSCQRNKEGVYKFVPGSATTLRTVHCNLSGLIMDALRELDEEERDKAAQAEGLEAEPAAEAQQEEGEPEIVATSEIEGVEQDSAAGDHLEEVETVPEPVFESRDVISLDGPQSQPASMDEVQPTIRAGTGDAETSFDQPPSVEMCMFDSAAVDDALMSLDAHLVDVAVENEENHE